MTGSTNYNYGAQFNTIANVIGISAAALLCKRFGGCERVYIPKAPSQEHVFRNIIGDHNFVKLVKDFGGLHIDVPRTPELPSKKPFIVDDIMQGKSNIDTALKHKVSPRYVRRVRAELKDLGVAIPEHSIGGRYLCVPPVPHEKVFEFLGWEEGSPRRRVALCATENSADAATETETTPQMVLHVRAFLRWIYGVGRGSKMAFSLIPKDRRDDPKAYLVDALKIIERHQPEAIGKAREPHGQD